MSKSVKTFSDTQIVNAMRQALDDTWRNKRAIDYGTAVYVAQQIRLALGIELELP